MSNLAHYAFLAHDFCRHHEGMSCQVNQDILHQFGLKEEHIDAVLDAFPDEMKFAEEILQIETEKRK